MTSTIREEIVLDDLERPRAPGLEGNRQSHIGNQPPPENEQPHGPEFSLPRADGGKDAWLFLACCFCIEALIWG